MTKKLELFSMLEVLVFQNFLNNYQFSYSESIDTGTTLKMTLSLEQLLNDARMLSNKLREQDNVADNAINQTNALQDRFEAMKQYDEDINKLNEIPKRKPRQKLIMEIAQESKQIKDLRTENLELKACLDEHQNAMELIMNKYREQMRQFMMTQKLEENIIAVLQASNVSEGALKEKVMEMAHVMREASIVDDNAIYDEQEKITQLVVENRGLKEMLRINRRHGVVSGPSHDGLEHIPDTTDSRISGTDLSESPNTDTLKKESP